MIVDTYTSNDLDKYALLDHTHDTYVTSDQVSTIVNSGISSGDIEVSSSMFKSITTYSLKKSSKSISGKGMMTIIDSNLDPDYTYIYIDDIRIDENCPIGATFLFNSSVELVSSHSSYYIYATVGILN